MNKMGDYYEGIDETDMEPENDGDDSNDGDETT